MSTGKLDRLCVKALTAVPPSANRFPVGLAAVPHTVPRELSAAPPLSVTVAPNVALLAVIEADVGVVTVGAEAAEETVPWIFKVPSLMRHVPDSASEEYP